MSTHEAHTESASDAAFPIDNAALHPIFPPRSACSPSVPPGTSGSAGEATKGHEDEERAVPAVDPAMKGSTRLEIVERRDTTAAVATRTRLLLVDDDPGVRFGLREFLSSCGFDVSEADSCEATLRALGESLPDLAILDFTLPDGDALSLLPRMREVAPDLGVVLLTGHGSVNLAVRAIRSGADHFLCKPVQLAELESILRGLGRQKHLERARRAERVRRDRRPIDPFAGSSPAIRRLAAEAARAAESDAPVLVTGPAGSGKSVLATWLHRHGTRADEPFVDLHCASLSPELVDAELFGPARGRGGDRPGLLQVADHGTLLLEEIGELSLESQARLVEVIDCRRYRPAGEPGDRRADVRLIAATQQDLAARVARGSFRSDLFDRLRATALRVPALDERLEDLPLLASRMLSRLAQDSGRPEPRLTPEMVAKLRTHGWPGNLRELHNVLERSLLLARDRELVVADIGFENGSGHPTASAPPEIGAPLMLEEVERRHILAILAARNGNVQEAAAALGVPRSSLYQKLQRFGVRLRGRGARTNAPAQGG